MSRTFITTIHPRSCDTRRPYEAEKYQFRGASRDGRRDKASHINHGLLEKLETRRGLLATFSSFFSSFHFFLPPESTRIYGGMCHRTLEGKQRLLNRGNSDMPPRNESDSFVIPFEDFSRQLNADCHSPLLAGSDSWTRT